MQSSNQMDNEDKQIVPSQEQKISQPIDTNEAIFNIAKDRIFGMRADLPICLFLCTITLAVYWQVTNHEFINYDDNVYVTDNLRIQDGLTLENFIWSSSAVVSGNWHPLTLLSHMLDCQLYGLNPGMHHLTNLIFHITNTLLLFFVFRRMTHAPWKSAFVAALFSFHPLHTESVAWISERKDLLSTFFWLLTMWAYCRYVECPGKIRYTSALFFFILGLMAKPMLVTLPFVLLLIDYWPLKRAYLEKSHMKALVLEKTPFFVLSAASCAVTLYTQQMGGAVAPFTVFSLDLRIANALVSYVSYIGKTIYPFNLAILYPHPRAIPEWQTAGACLLLLIATFLAIRNIERFPWLLTGWLWYLGTLVPVIGLVQVGDQAMADRYTYIPLIGLFIIVAWSVPKLVSRWRYKQYGLKIIASAFLLILTTITLRQLSYWKDNITLYEHTLGVTSNNHVAHYNLGIAFADQGLLVEAVTHYYEALKINPGIPEAHCALGLILMDHGRLNAAKGHFYQALRINPNYAEAHNNLGIALFKQGNIVEAMRYYCAALRIKPEFASAHNNLANVLKEQGKIAEAINHYSEALRIKPDLVDAHYNLALLLTTEGRYDEAIRHYAEILKMNPRDAEIHNKLGIALFLKGNIEASVAHFREALRIKPGYENAQFNLNSVLALQGKQRRPAVQLRDK